MKKVVVIIAVLCLVRTIDVLAQVPRIPPPAQFEEDVVALVDKAKAEMNRGDYEEANKTFRAALATKKVLPTSMSYFFAETLFVIHQNQNALNFVDKYIELAGQGGDYYDEAVRLKSLINTQFEAIKNCQYCNLSGYRYVECTNCGGLGHTVAVCYNCQGNGLIMCPKCIGRGVLISLNSLGGHVYKSCDLCESKGYITCNICNGEKELSGRCNVCLGTGKMVSKIICNHNPVQ